MTEDLNTATPNDVQSDLVNKASKMAIFGWIAFFITLFALIIQNLIIMLKPAQVLATEDGTVVGQVIFDEARIRPEDMILADLKTWVQNCTSVNKNTIYEDLSVCLNHMVPELAESRMTEFEETNYVVNVANIGCERTSIAFDDEQIWIKKDELGYGVEAQIVGEVICPQSSGTTPSQEFNIRLAGKLTPRNTTYPLGFNVTVYEDVQ